MFKKGLVQVYTGDGKGKTTAAVGLAVRAAGHGNKVLFYQFLKPVSLELGERKSLGRIEGVTCRVLDRPWDMRRSLDDAAAVSVIRDGIREAIDELVEAASKGLFDLIILDEIVFCISKGLVEMEDIARLIGARASGVELVLTGRGACSELTDMADLVTEMRAIKHPFEKGTAARKGVEY